MDLSIVIPTFNERNNVRTITKRIQEALQGIQCKYEIYFVDDSRDDTPSILEDLSCQLPEVKFFHRTGPRGLGTAVAEGFNRTSGEYLVVMDADLQHPPELLPIIYRRLLQGIDVVIPSRFVQGGSDGGLSGFRKMVSWTARTIGRVSIKRMRDISDCTGGYFGLHRQVILEASLDPIGWKILMEVLVKGNYNTVHEIPYQFVARDAGESKMSFLEQWNYLKHVVKLVWSSNEDRRFYLFCMVGALGVFVNMLALMVFVKVFMDGLIASVAASLIAMIHNFIWNDNVTWKGYQNQLLWRRVLQLPQFIMISGIGIALTAGFVQFALWQNWNIYMGQLTGIVAATAWNFMANNRWTWGRGKADIKRDKIKVTQESFQNYAI